MLTPAELLYKAAEYIGEHGHHKGAYEGPDGSVCALGALRKVDNHEFLVDAFISRHHGPSYFAATALQNRVGPIDKWNDSSETSAEDVILTLKTVASQLEEIA